MQKTNYKFTQEDNQILEKVKQDIVSPENFDSLIASLASWDGKHALLGSHRDLSSSLYSPFYLSRDIRLILMPPPPILLMKAST